MQEEVLVVTADTDRSGHLLAEVGRRVRVTQLLPPRLALVLLDDRGAEELRALPGVSVFTDAGPRPAGLNDRERLFVDAWMSRGTGKVRAANGLAWDAPGYVPPDPPPTSQP
jgi:hypothetical protein